MPPWIPIKRALKTSQIFKQNLNFIIHNLIWHRVYHKIVLWRISLMSHFSWFMWKIHSRIQKKKTIWKRKRELGERLKHTIPFFPLFHNLRSSRCLNRFMYQIIQIFRAWNALKSIFLFSQEKSFHLVYSSKIFLV